MTRVFKNRRLRLAHRNRRRERSGERGRVMDCELVGHMAPEADCRIYLGLVKAIGVIDDPNSEPAKLIRNRNGMQPRPESGADPSNHYVF